MYRYWPKAALVGVEASCLSLQSHQVLDLGAALLLPKWQSSSAGN